MQYYQLTIESKKNINEICNCNFFRLNGRFWIYDITEDETTDYVDFFIQFIKKNKEKLQNNGITSDDITVWLLYEYEQQCSLRISAKDMELLGEENIVLCVSCWEKDTTLDLSYDNPYLNEEKILYLLKVKTDKNPNDFFSRKNFCFDNGWWCYQTDNVRHGIHELVSLIKNNQKQIFPNGISAEDINICFYYEYASECSWEFSSEEMKELGNLGLDLFITCKKINFN